MGTAIVVLNPVAGESDADVGHTIQDHFQGAGWTCHLHHTTAQESVTDVVRSALTGHPDALDLVVAAGGDGTVAGVASGLVQSSVPLGLLPLGTGNALARELGVPLSTLDALHLLTGPHATATVDALAVGDRLFLLSVSLGLSGLTMRDTERDHKRRFGRIAYVWTGLRKLIGYQPHRFRVTIDGHPRTFHASELAIANSGALGDPALRWSPQVDLDDGQADVIVVRARNALDYLRLATAFVLRRQRQEPGIRHFTARRRVAVHVPTHLPVQADGQFIGHPPLEIDVVPHAVDVVVPEPDHTRRFHIPTPGKET